jgi:hypothetical protein
MSSCCTGGAEGVGGSQTFCVVLRIGNGCLTHAEEQTQMALWSISAALVWAPPVIRTTTSADLSAPLPSILPTSKALLTGGCDDGSSSWETTYETPPESSFSTALPLQSTKTLSDEWETAATTPAYDTGCPLSQLQGQCGGGVSRGGGSAALGAPPGQRCAKGLRRPVPPRSTDTHGRSTDENAPRSGDAAVALFNRDGGTPAGLRLVKRGAFCSAHTLGFGFGLFTLQTCRDAVQRNGASAGPAARPTGRRASSAAADSAGKMIPARAIA